MNLQNEILKAITSVIEIEKLLDIMTKSLKQELKLDFLDAELLVCALHLLLVLL